MKPPPTLLPIFFSLFIIFTSGADIPPGSTLSASNPNYTWNSPNNAFSLCFISDGSAFFAAVTYFGVSVWIAGGEGGAADSSASLQFLSDGNLRLVNGSSASAVVWESATAGRGVSAAALDNSGNFFLRNGNVSIWSTFDNPTDTILPSQNFTINSELRSGSYSFSLLSSGNLTLKWNNSIVYWNLGLNSSINNINLTSPILQLQPVGILLISDPSLKSGAILSYSSDYAEGTDVLRFLRLDSDGNLRIYSSAMGSGRSTERWSAVSDQCQVFGYCGNLGICSYNDSNPVCGCPSMNFEPIDPKDSRGGCKRKMEIEDCPGSATMLALEHAMFLTYPPEVSSQVFFVGISACRLNCLVSGSCIASTSLSDGTGLCYLKYPNFVSGYQSAALPSTSYVKVCGPIVQTPPSSSLGVGKNNGWRLHAWIVVVVVIGTILGLVMVEGGLWWWCCRNSPKFGGLSAQYALLEYASGAPVQFSYGMVLLEIVSGRRNFDVSEETNRKKFSVWAYEEFEKGNVKGIVDKRLTDHEMHMEQVIRAILVSFWCIQEQPSQRPMMGKVVQMLEGITEIEKPPIPKAVPEGSVSGTSVNVSSSVSALSTFAASAPAPSSSSSFQTQGIASSVSGRNVEKADIMSFTV
ncbi:lectin protein kinase family protein [Actinidia rufa]|uniref:Lectin protein kinase family protein n=1 Tax=Actinidia rufa TaxID=165716 RepID=A0A7J0GLK3_9ERIC|nr:lectin protein kinase family protein [Actinidia rufa]